MVTSDEVSSLLQTWSPSLTENLTALAYLGAEGPLTWLTDTDRLMLSQSIIGKEGHEPAVELWALVLSEDIALSAPVFLVILEHLRHHPARCSRAMIGTKLNFTKTLVNVAFRAANALYEDAKQSFADSEIDTSVARFRLALSEFRFSIESMLLNDPTRRIALGKYATAVAMIGRWINLPPETVLRGLEYSNESIQLGNKNPESLLYRLELLLQQFDQTGDKSILYEARSLTKTSPKIGASTELIQVEILLRIAFLPSEQASDSDTYRQIASKLFERYRPTNSFEQARRNVIGTFIKLADQGDINIEAQSLAVPRGLVAAMASKPSGDLWRTVRSVIGGLQELRHSEKSVPAAVLSAQLLRQVIYGPEELRNQDDLTSYMDVMVWLADWPTSNRHLRWEAGSAELAAAILPGKQYLAKSALRRFELLATRYPNWPLPLIGIARAHDFLFHEAHPSGQPSTEFWMAAANLTLASTAYERLNLGGRNEVFAVGDARGFLSETFVFKRTSKAKAEHEASMFEALRSEIDWQGKANRFAVPRSLAIVEIPVETDPMETDPPETDTGWIHVSQRATGRLASDLRADDTSGALIAIVDLLAMFHRVAGTPLEGKSAWRSMKKSLIMWSRTLFDLAEANAFVNSMHDLFPSHLPLVRKRDGHASNWLIDSAGRIVAIDLESSDFLPIGYDLVQLVEDAALVPPDEGGWLKRISLMEHYLNNLEVELTRDDLVSAYGWFALARALRLGTESGAGKHLRRHAREICSLLVDFGDGGTKIVARKLLLALSRVEESYSVQPGSGENYQRLSKAMAYMLRHSGPANGVPIDQSGYASMTDLAGALKTEPSQLTAVVEHPAEPRFEIRDRRIRALYGHSLEVFVRAGIRIREPLTLYHGTNWSALEGIILQGLDPMQRQMVHLVNLSTEAIEVGKRKGAPLVLSIAQESDSEPVAEPVAEGIWVSKRVPADRISIVNSYADESRQNT